MHFTVASAPRASHAEVRDVLQPIRSSFLFLVLCTLISPVFAASLRDRIGPHPTPPFTDESASFSVPFQYFEHHLYVTVSVNGHAGLIFLVDTGTSANILDLGVSRQLGIPVEKITRARDLGLGGGKVSIAGAQHVDVRLDNHPIADTLAIVNLHGLASDMRHPIDGILGYPLLRRFVTGINFETSQITLWPARSFRYHGGGEIMALSRKGNVPTIPITVATVTQLTRNARVEVDTGSDATLLLYPQYAHRTHLDNSFLKMKSGQAYGLGGLFPVRPGVLGSMTMGNIMVVRFIAFLMQTKPLVTRRDVCGVIGTSVLGSYRRVIFDVPRNRIIFELPPAIPPLRQASNAPPPGPSL
uniref:Peptidase A2 domain-containing protein n=1 Tax=Acidobacterium capsulatum TaxID=33075 RepID=A0A7V4XSM9_9BACT